MYKMDSISKRPSYRGDRGRQKQIHYVVENIYNHEIDEIVSHLLNNLKKRPNFWIELNNLAKFKHQTTNDD